MNLFKVSGIVMALGLLSACAMTPAEKAASEEAHRRAILNTQVSLAQQCSPKTAQLIAERPNIGVLSAKDQKAFNESYAKAVNNPAFQACYNLAWKSYREQNELQVAQMQLWNEANQFNWDNGFYFNEPFGFYY